MDNKPAKVQLGIMQIISAGASRRELVRTFGKLTPSIVLGGSFPSLARLRKEHTEEKIESALAMLIADAALAFGEDMQEDLALELAAEILSTFYWLTLEDCYLVLKQMKHQKQFGKFTINKVLAAFNTYANERIELAEQINYNQHLNHKEPANYTATGDSHIKKYIKKKKNDK